MLSLALYRFMLKRKLLRFFVKVYIFFQRHRILMHFNAIESDITKVINVPLRAIMTTPVATVSPDGNLSYVVSVMMNKTISCVIVANGDVPIGIITESDLLRKVPYQSDILKKLKAKDVMTSPLIAADETTSVLDANEEMLKRHIRKLPVIKEGKIVGIVTQTDVVRQVDRF